MALSGKPLKIGRLSALTGYHLRRASTIFVVDFRDTVEGTGMQQVLVGILAVVEANPGINQGMVGTALGIKPANMVSLIDELVARGLIDRAVTPANRRALSLTTTPDGDAMLATCMDLITPHEARLLASFSEAERRTLLDLLSRVHTRRSRSARPTGTLACSGGTPAACADQPGELDTISPVAK